MKDNNSKLGCFGKVQGRGHSCRWEGAESLGQSQEWDSAAGRSSHEKIIKYITGSPFYSSRDARQVINLGKAEEQEKQPQKQGLSA